MDTEIRDLTPVVVVGAGVAGLTLARELRARGDAPLVLERSRGVGGRCATRRVEGQPVDHGLGFLHGRDPRFLAELDAISDATVVEDWPRTTDGAGTPCRPVAFDAGSRRVAVPEGVNRLAKHLARGTDVRLSANVTAVRWTESPDRVWELSIATGETLRTRRLALTMPASSAAALLRAIAPLPADVGAILPLLDLVHHLPCLTLIARYPRGTASPPWDASFPDERSAIQTILHDSSKRAAPERVVLVIQARARFSRIHLEEPALSWTRTLLSDAAARHGTWILEPDLVQPHVWRKARVASSSELARPLVVRVCDDALLAVVGDGLHPAGGVEGAFLSGLALADLLAGSGPESARRK